MVELSPQGCQGAFPWQNLKLDATRFVVLLRPLPPALELEKEALATMASD